MPSTLSARREQDKPKLLDQRVKLCLRAMGEAQLMHYVYVLRSLTDDGFYIGYSANLRRRFDQHSRGDSFATSYRGPWKLIYYEAYLNQADALGRERYLKSGAGPPIPRSTAEKYLEENTA